MSIRMIPCSSYDLPAMEAWLAEQAGKGRRLCGTFGFWARFQKGAPLAETYRLEVGDGKPRPDPEKLEVYRAAGWDFCCCVATEGDLWAFRANRPDPTPIHTDPETQGIAYARLCKRLRRRAIPEVLWVLCCLFVYLPGAFRVSLAELARSADFLLRALYFVLLVPLVLLPSWGDRRALGKLTKCLQAGFPIERPARPRRRRAMAVWWAAFGVCAAASCFLLFRAYDAASWPDAADCPQPLPCVPVELLGGASAPGPSAEWREGDLATDIYIIRDGALVDSPEGRVKQGCTDAYRMRIVALAGPLLTELRQRELPADAALLADSPFDEAWYGRDGDFQYLAARQGRWVLWTRAKVPEDLRDHLADFQAALERMEESE
jgi:hypothetical protein